MVGDTSITYGGIVDLRQTEFEKVMMLRFFAFTRGHGRESAVLRKPVG
jgi:hypothetical protein